MTSKSTQRNPLLIPLLVVLVAAILAIVLLFVRSSDLKQQVATLNTTVDSVSAALNQANANLTAATQQKTEAEAEVAALNEQVSALTAELESANQALAAVNEELLTATKQQVTDTQMISALKSEKAGLTARIDRLTEQLNEKTAALATASENLEQAKADMERLQAEHAAQVVLLTAERDQLSQQLRDTEASLAAAQVSYEEASAEAEKHTLTLIAANTQIMELKKELEAAQSEKNDLNQTVTGLQNKLQEAQDALVSANAAKDKADAHVAALNTEKGTLELSITELNARLEDVNLQLRVAEDCQTAADATIAELTEAKASLETELAQLNTQLESVNAQLLAAQSSLTTADASYTEANEQIAALNAQIGSANAALVAAQSNLTTTIAELEAAQAENAALTAQVAELTEAKAAVEGEKAALTAQVGELTEAKAAAETKNAELAATLSDTQNTMIELLSQHAVAEGFGGMVKVSAIINAQGQVAYLTVDAASETAGLGQQVMEPAFLTQFLGKRLPLTLGTDVDAVAGATVTSQAVVDALNLLAPEYDNARSGDSVIRQRSVTKEIAYVQRVQGHDSQMKVVVYTTPEGTVTAVKVFAQDEKQGKQVMANAFTGQFVGRSSAVTLGVDVDAVAGATATSQAVVDAVNNIIE